MKRRVLVVLIALAAISAAGLAQTLDPALNALWGSDITAGELMAATDPAALAGMSERMRDTKVTWASGPGPMCGVSYFTESSASRELDERLIPIFGFIGCAAIVALKVRRR